MEKGSGPGRRFVLWAALGVAALALLVVTVVPGLRGPEQAAPAYWPTQAWRSSTLEEQGLDSARWAEALLAIKQENIDIHSLLLVRNGSVALEAYFYPYDGSTVHELASVTKSIMTTLIAIAAEQGKLKLDQPMVSFFPDRTIANRDARKERITVRHLTSMSSGLESMGKERDEGTLQEMRTSPDWVQFALDRKVVTEPGTHFVYDSPGMHLLSAILQQSTGMTALDFARQNLFEPLGIRDAIWNTDPQGYNRGSEGVYLHPRDAAKIGYLWLNKGVWEGKQIVSREWVENSSKSQIKTGEDDDYGYGWWITTENGVYTAAGRGGQYIKVVPAFNAIVVTTGGGFDYDEIDPYLIRATGDVTKLLLANTAGIAKLNEALATVVQPPAPQPVKTLPETARTISGRTFVFEQNPAQLKTARLEFADSAEAVLQLAFTDNRPLTSSRVGLDGLYRFVPGNYDLPSGMRGYWADAQTFVLEQDAIANNDHVHLRMYFEGNGVLIEVRETAHEFGMRLEGRVQNP